MCYQIHSTSQLSLHNSCLFTPCKRHSCTAKCWKVYYMQFIHSIGSVKSHLWLHGGATANMLESVMIVLCCTAQEMCQLRSKKCQLCSRLSQVIAVNHHERAVARGTSKCQNCQLFIRELTYFACWSDRACWQNSKVALCGGQIFFPISCFRVSLVWHSRSFPFYSAFQTDGYAKLQRQL